MNKLDPDLEMYDSPIGDMPDSFTIESLRDTSKIRKDIEDKFLSIQTKFSGQKLLLEFAEKYSKLDLSEFNGDNLRSLFELLEYIYSAFLMHKAGAINDETLKSFFARLDPYLVPSISSDIPKTSVEAVTSPGLLEKLAQESGIDLEFLQSYFGTLFERSDGLKVRVLKL